MVECAERSGDAVRLVETAFNYHPLRLTVLAAPDLDSLLTPDTDVERLPYWAVIWDSAAALARWMVERGSWEGVEVLELGCGPGLAGLAAAALGAEVIQTDLFVEAVALAQWNAARNGLPRIRHAAADWRAWPFTRTWPVVIGSDLTYDRALHMPLLRVLEKSLSPGGSAYLGDPDRAMSLEFLVRAEAAGWMVEIETAPPPPPSEREEKPVSVYILQR